MTGFTSDLEQSLTDLGDRVVAAVRDKGVRVAILDDRCVDRETRAMPMAMVIGYLNQRLLQEKLREFQP